MFNKKGFIFWLLIFLGLLIFVFRAMIFGASTKLFNWTEYPYVIWLIYQGIGKISDFNFSDFGTTSAFFPAKDSYFFSDLYLPQAAMAVPFLPLVHSPILMFNILFIITFVLNYISLYLFWSIWFKKAWQCFLASVLFVFSPFFHIQIEHFQMLSYWPLFFSLFFFIKNKTFKYSSSIISGLFLVIQFLTSVYLGVFLIFMLCLRTFLNLFKNKKREAIKSFFIVVSVFLVGASFFISKYIQVKNDNHFVRDYKEFMSSSADITDYIFTTKIDSIVGRLDFVKKWNSIDRHKLGEVAAFPGLAMTIAGIAYLLNFSFKKKNIFKINISWKFEDIFFVALLFFGLVFSLGPQLNFNGYWSGIPTFYSLLIKYVPFLEVIRGLSRWSFLFYLSLSYFLVAFLSRRKVWVVLLVVLLFFLENLPVFIKAQAEEYLDPKSDYVLKEICNSNNNVLLEIPTGQLEAGINPVVGQNYISKRQLASVYHGCNLVNGYSGFEPWEHTLFFRELNKALVDNNVVTIMNLLRSRRVSYLRVSDGLIKISDAEKYRSSISLLIKLGKIIPLSENLFKVSY